MIITAHCIIQSYTYLDFHSIQRELNPDSIQTRFHVVEKPCHRCNTDTQRNNFERRGSQRPTQRIPIESPQFHRRASIRSRHSFPQFDSFSQLLFFFLSPSQTEGEILKLSILIRVLKNQLVPYFSLCIFSTSFSITSGGWASINFLVSISSKSKGRSSGTLK